LIVKFIPKERGGDPDFPGIKELAPYYTTKKRVEPDDKETERD
jgi:hypothetical protein